ncbi:MAG: aminotransferase class V-fold PLP-dependent enzyme [Pigmentiphaga sp.]|nr:aminotransferase class V-fold PLP-dependent enzyme [Pigmentiphaga sp.]
MSHPFAEYRRLFPILQQAAQLSSCSQSAMSLPVRDAITQYLDGWEKRGMDWGGWMEGVAGARAEFARLIGASLDDIAVLGSVSDAASSVVSSLSFPAERRYVVASTLDFPSLCHVWLAQEPRGAKVRFVEGRPGVDDAAARLSAAVADDTAVVAVSHASFYDGQLTDLAASAQAAHEHGALQFVDAYQSAGSVPIDVVAQGVDVLAAGAQKYLLGIPGIAFLYVSPARAAQLQPAVTGWFGRVEPFAFDPRKLDFPATGAKFNTGTPPMLPAAAAHAALRLLNEIGVEAIQGWLRQLSAVAMAEADALGLEVVSPRNLDAKGGNTAIRVAGASAVEQAMAQRGYIVSARNDVIRIAPHFYNTVDEVAGAVRTLAELVNG